MGQAERSQLVYCRRSLIQIVFCFRFVAFYTCCNFRSLNARFSLTKYARKNSNWSYVNWIARLGHTVNLEGPVDYNAGEGWFPFAIVRTNMSRILPIECGSTNSVICSIDALCCAALLWTPINRMIRWCLSLHSASIIDIDSRILVDSMTTAVNINPDSNNLHACIQTF